MLLISLSIPISIIIFTLLYVKNIFNNSKPTKDIRSMISSCLKEKEYLWLIVTLLLTTILLIIKNNQNNIINFIMVIVLNSILLYIAFFDYKYKKIQNKVVLFLLGLWSIFFIVTFIGNNLQLVWENLFKSLEGVLFTTLVFIPTYVISKKSIGGGDVKLFLVLALYFQYSGIVFVTLISLISSSLFGMISILTKKMNRKSQLPLAPFIYVGCFVTTWLLI